MKQSIILAHLMFSILSLLLLVKQSQAEIIPPNWWEKVNARSVSGWDDFKKITEVDHKDKIIFIDFYMQYCPWCFRLMDDFNRIVEDMTEWYGPEQVLFLKIDGPYNRDISFQFRVGGYPTIYSVLPNTNGAPHQQFSAFPRNYDNLKKWMLEIMGSTPMRPGQKLPSHEQEEQLRKLKQTIEETLNDQQIKQSETMSHAFIDILKQVGESSIKQSDKLNDLIKHYEAIVNTTTEILDQEEQNQKQQEGYLDSAFNNFLIGTIAGGISAFLIVIYLNLNTFASDQQKKKKVNPSLIRPQSDIQEKSA
ncbi:thioredoxin domain-containing protein [Stylonychia lemnae]|uniref:Thioredoxin domain-containing protein n=1 Tax=Stylonychia lemnae TaxID=5949 RepID=A0A078AEJ8_STYLE|nr:thioredoxin domain-containing protein [Stylonychia lemnae]|eukprot:CDW79892.1 thioredoxin domain-containing protein [Stylonychia lemnae]